jgi:cytochrome P450 family 135
MPDLRLRARGRRTTLPPGSRLPAIVQTALLVRDPIGRLERCERRYGPVFRVRMVGAPRRAYVTDPVLAREILTSDEAGALVGEARRDVVEQLVGEHSLVTVDGDEWLRRRGLVAPAFKRQNVEQLQSDIAALARAHIDRWPIGEAFALRTAVRAITMEVIVELVVGSADASRLDRLRNLLPKVMDAYASPVLWLFPGAMRVRGVLRSTPGPLRRFLRLRDELDALLYEEIEARRAASDEDRRDVLSRLMASRDDQGPAMSDIELRDEVVGLLVAGHETTATALAWAFERLSRSPDVLARLRAELDEGSDDRYLEAVVKETLRARAVGLDAPRLLSRPLTVGAYVLPAGWYVTPVLPLVQRAADGRDEFRPDRFLQPGAATRAWMPFGAGKRHCVGSHLALLEMKVVIREILRALDLESVDAAPEGIKLHHVTLVPSEPARVRATRREQVSRSSP